MVALRSLRPDLKLEDRNRICYCIRLQTVPVSWKFLSTLRIRLLCISRLQVSWIAPRATAYSRANCAKWQSAIISAKLNLIIYDNCVIGDWARWRVRAKTGSAELYYQECQLASRVLFFRSFRADTEMRKKCFVVREKKMTTKRETKETRNIFFHSSRKFPEQAQRQIGNILCSILLLFTLFRPRNQAICLFFWAIKTDLWTFEPIRVS